jgi:hypothetical protein
LERTSQRHISGTGSEKKLARMSGLWSPHWQPVFGWRITASAIFRAREPVLDPRRDLVDVLRRDEDLALAHGPRAVPAALADAVAPLPHAVVAGAVALIDGQLV